MHPGHRYGDEIIRGIEKSQAFILVLSAASNEFPFVAREIERAVSKKKPIFTIRVEAVDPAVARTLHLRYPMDRCLLRQARASYRPAGDPASRGGRSRARDSERGKCKPRFARIAMAVALGARRSSPIGWTGRGFLWNFHRQEAENLPPSPVAKSTAEPGVAVVTPPEASQSKAGTSNPRSLRCPIPR